MRIACLHFPQFALQCATRIAPALRSQPVAIIGTSAAEPGGRGRGAQHGPVVQACSRAAWAMGVRVGMPVARAEAHELVVLAADGAAERDTVRAIADALLHIAPVVDLGGRVGPNGAHLAVYCEVPSRTRGVTFGERALERLAELGLTARIGIADDRFTAWVAATSIAAADARKRLGEIRRESDAATLAAASSRVFDWVAPEPLRAEVKVDADPPHTVPHVTCVPRGGSAAYLAPRPLSLLSITPEVQRVLEALGIATLGEFAALPAPSVARPFEADFQALARGEGGHALRPYAPDAPIREEIARDDATGMGVVVATLARRIGLRLAGRGRSAARVDVAITAAGGERTVRVDLLGRAPQLEAHSDEYVEALAEAIGDAIGEAGERIAVTVVGEALGTASAVPVAATSSLGSAPVAQIAAAAPAVRPVDGPWVHARSSHAQTRLRLQEPAHPEVAQDRPLRDALDVAGRALQPGDARIVPSQELRLPDAAHQDEIDALSVVLASTGTVDLAQVLQMSMAQGLERGVWREYRRTRRGKQRRRHERTESVQPKLFKNLP